MSYLDIWRIPLVFGLFFMSQSILSSVSSADTSLFDAADSGDLVKVQRLIESGADVNQTNESGWTPLMAAALKNHTEIMAALLETGRVDVNQTDQNQRTALMKAVYADQTQAVQLLLGIPEVQILLADISNRTALVKAVYWGNLEIVKVFLEMRGNEISLEDLQNLIPLINHKPQEMLELLRNEMIVHSREIKEELSRKTIADLANVQLSYISP